MLVQTEATQRRLPGGGDHDREDEGVVAGDIPGNIVLLIINKSGGLFWTMPMTSSMMFLVTMSLTMTLNR